MYLDQLIDSLRVQAGSTVPGFEFLFPVVPAKAGTQRRFFD